MSSPTTDNDEAIAQALAREEQDRADSDLARQMESQQLGPGNSIGNPFSGIIPPPPASHRPVVQGRRIINCPGQHGLNEFLVSYAQRVQCNICNKRLQRDDRAYGCVACNFDVCEECKQRGGPPPGARAPGDSTTSSGSSSASPFPFPAPPGFQAPASSAHMCIAPCVIGDGVCVEMMVDTGAQTSVISSSLARQLGLESRIDRSQQGVAAGVGRARIVGRIRNIICELGHVEFPMDFIVLDTQDKILLLGLDLMRRYKCIVDLERDVLVFGGKGGVEVHMLPADEQHIQLRDRIGCPMM